MLVSEARIRANRANGALGRGPTSAPGKAVSRRNSLKAGLSGKTTVTPEGVAEEIARRVEALTVEMRPRTTAGASLIVQMATCSVRMERAAEHETAAIAFRVRHAVDAFDEERIEAADLVFEKLADEPRSGLRQLRKSPEGLEKLCESWEDLRNDLTVGVWGDDQLERAVNLAGLKARHAGGTMFAALTQAIRGDFSALDPGEGGGLDDAARRSWANSRLFAMIDEQIAALEAHAETLDFETIDLDRAEAPGRALFDDSKPACLARRYEAEASRGFFRALKEFRKVEADFVDQAQPTPVEAPVSAAIPPSPASRMGSIRETPPSPDRPPVRTAPVAGPREIPVVRDASGLPLSIGRPLQTAG